MTGKQFKLARKSRGLTQNEVAERLRVSQTYVALLEQGRRCFPVGLARKAVSLLRMSPCALPLSAQRSTETGDLTRQLSALGYPGFAQVRPTRRQNPAEVLLAALGRDNLEARVAEALPWLVLHAYEDMAEGCRVWLVQQARLRGLTNRLGFTVSLAKQVAKRRGETGSQTYRALYDFEKQLDQTRLAKLDTYCQSDLSPAKQEWLRDARPEAAKHWNLLTNWQPDHLQYV